MEKQQVGKLIGLLDTEGVDKKLDGIMALLRKNLRMDVAFISEFTAGRRVFRHVEKMDPQSPIQEGGSDLLEQTYCQQLVDGDIPEVIRDVRDYPSLWNLEATRDLGIGSYVGVPLHLPNGDLYGTFCCYSAQPDQSLNERDLSFFRVIAAIAGGLIDQKIEHDHKAELIASGIQKITEENRLGIHLQPIWDLKRNQACGYEALSRFDTAPYRTPDVWFAEAEQAGLGEFLEMHALKMACECLEILPADCYLSLNTSPKHIISGALAKVLEGSDLARLVIEVTEHTSVTDYKELKKALVPLRQKGLRLAIDDAGSGYATFSHILELDPDIIKLDLSLCRNIHKEEKKFSLAKALLTYAGETGSLITAEGIEQHEELDVLIGLGIDMAQGYLLGKPMPSSELATFTEAHQSASSG